MVKKAVILAGGKGTRFLPYTKACPKEMFALSGKPVLHYIVEEVVSAGIKDILIIINPEKEMIKNYFSPDKKLYDFLEKNGKVKELEQLHKIDNLANLSYAIQYDAKGSGDALMLAKEFANGQPLAVLNADDVMVTVGDTVMKQVIDCYGRNKTSVLGVQQVPDDILVSCGAINIVERDGRDIKIDCVIEKPALADAPSNLVTLGRYVVSSDYFDILSRTPLSKNGELNLTDALNLQAIEQGIYAYEFEGKRYDMGNKFGSFEAMVDFALMDADISDKVKAYLKTKF